MTGHPEFGLPFGQDRLVPIFLATLAVRQQSRTIRLNSASLMLDRFGMAQGGRLRTDLRRGDVLRNRQTTASARVVHRARFNFSSEARSWYQRGEDDGVGEAAITLNEEFFAEVMAHPIPADLERSKGWSPRPE